MMKLIRCVALAASLTLVQVPSHASDDEIVPIELELVSDQDAIVPGRKFTVGIRQKMLPGYHTYWRNPGTIGMGMRLEWKLPDGFKAGEIQWPSPEIGHMAVYKIWGYHNSALMLVDLSPPANLEIGGKVTLKTQAIWMCCGKSCHPGHKMLELTLPVRETAKRDSKRSQEFAVTRSDQPRSIDAWRISCEMKGDEYRLRIRSLDGRAVPADVQFFGYDRLVSSDKGQRVRRSKTGATIIVMQHEEHTGERLPRLRGILSTTGEWKPGTRNLAVDIPIVEAK